MKKTILFVLLTALLLCAAMPAFATEQYSIDKASAKELIGHPDTVKIPSNAHSFAISDSVYFQWVTKQKDAGIFTVESNFYGTLLVQASGEYSVVEINGPGEYEIAKFNGKNINMVYVCGVQQGGEAQ